MMDTIRVKELKEVFDNFSHSYDIEVIPYPDWKKINKFIKESSPNDRLEIAFHRDKVELYIKGTIYTFPFGENEKTTFGDMLEDYFLPDMLEA